MFQKKFKTRVRHYRNDNYVVEYAYYCILPIWWNALCFWFEQGLTGDIERWSTNLLKFAEAEKLAMSLKSIEDVREYYKADKEKERDFYKRKKEYHKKNVPYKVKYF